jgi:hypothetical protein
MLKPALTALVFTAALGGCAKHLEAPTDVGVCYAMSMDKDGKPQFNPVAENMPNMENCAAQLEGMRLRFARMGALMHEVTGTYQGTWIFVRQEGIFTSKTYEGVQFPALVRTGDGRLAVPGVMPAQ